MPCGYPRVKKGKDSSSVRKFEILSDSYTLWQLCGSAAAVSPFVAVGGLAPPTLSAKVSPPLLTTVTKNLWFPTGYALPLLSYTASVLIHQLSPANQLINFRNDVGVIVYQAVSPLD